MNGPLTPVHSHGEAACARALRLLDAYLDGELTVETTHELLGHIERCARCERESAAREALRQALKRVAARGGEDGPDPLLAARIRSGLSAGRGAAWRPYLLAAAAVLAAAIGVTRWRGGVEEKALRVAEETQVHCALGLRWPEAPPAAAALAASAGPELSPLLPRLAERLPGWGIVAAHRCTQEGATVYHVILRKSGASGPESLASLVVVQERRGPEGARSLIEERGLVLVSEAGKSGTAFVVTGGGREAAMEMGRRALPLLRQLA